MKTLSAIGLAIALALVASTASAQNLLTNPGFEDLGGSFNGWITFDSGEDISTPLNDDIYRSGTAAAKVFGEGTGCPFPVFDDSGFYQDIPATPGKIYEYSGWTFISSADPIPGTSPCFNNRALAKISFRDISDNEVQSNEVTIGNPLTPVDQWIPFTVSAPAPANAVAAQILIVFLQPGCDTGAVFLDDFLVTESDPPASNPNLLVNPSFDSPVETGWVIFGEARDEARAGNGLVRTIPGSIAIFGTFVEGLDSGITQTITDVSPMGVYEFSAYTLNTCFENPIFGLNENYMFGQIIFLSATNDTLKVADATFADATSPLGNWTKQSVTAAAPANTDRAEVYVIFKQPDIAAQGKFFIDDVFFGLSSSVTAAPSASRGVVLEQNNPNPFNPKTTIRFELDRTGDVSLRVFDVKGRLITTLADRSFEAGSHVLTWDGRSADGRAVPSGTYHYVLQTAAGREARSMVLLK
jgi:hypothetical protein